MKIVLSTPPWKTTELWPPLGLLYIASSIRASRNDEVKVLDAFCMNLSKEECASWIIEQKPQVVGFNCSTHTFMQTMETLSEIRKGLPDAIMVLGGYHATFAARQILKEYPFIDYVLKGEAERSFVQLLDALEKGDDPREVEGIAYLRGEELIDNPLALIDDLDSLRFPDRSLLGAVSYGYKFQGIPLTFGKFTTLSTSRGCPFSCSYCSCAAFSLQKWRYRSAENVVEEMEQLYREGYEECVLVDDNFTHRTKRVEEICRLILEKGIKMQLYCEGRADHADLSHYKQMKKAGFDVIYFGTESASPQVLDYYNKKITPEKNRQAILNAKKANMLVICSFIIGAPIETKEEIEKTIQFVKETRPHGVQFNVLDVLLGTPIWNDMVNSGKIGPGDWKTNHRIYEFAGNGLTQEELEGFAKQGYDAYISGWKTRAGAGELLRTLRHNRTARRVVMKNILNPAARAAVFGDLNAVEGKKIDAKDRD